MQFNSAVTVIISWVNGIVLLEHKPGQPFKKLRTHWRWYFIKEGLTRIWNTKGQPLCPSHPGSALRALHWVRFLFFLTNTIPSPWARPGQAEVCRDWNLPIWQQPTELSYWLGTCSPSSWKLIPQRAAFAYAKSISKASPAYSAVYHTHMSSNIIMYSQSSSC